MVSQRAWPWLSFAIVVAVVGCHDGTCHWPWENDPIGDLFGDGEHGDPCIDTSECGPGLVCAGDEVCRLNGEPGTADLGDPCASNQYCQLGLVCSSSGFCAEPGDPGTSGLGEDCQDTDDCQLGYSCIEGGCYGFQLPLWQGTECAARDSDTGPFRAYFEVPGAAPLSEFYRLPFPNDARVRADGTLDLTGHPTPGVLIEQLGDVVGEVFSVLEDDFDGFGNNQAAFFRYSRAIDYDSLARALPQDGGTWGVVDISPSSTNYGQLAPGGFRASSGRRQYICYNWISLHPYDGRPYRPGHTYAAFLGAGITIDDGTETLQQDADMTVLLTDGTPPDSRLHHAWEAYQPVRDWIADIGGLEAEDFAAVAVFTVGDPIAPMQSLRAAVLATNAPAEAGLHLCAAGNGGPYDDGTGRGCDGESSVVHEIQGTVSLPQFQQGLPPFKDIADGGEIDFSAGDPAVAFVDDVHFTLTIPKGVSMPPDGWPLVLYGHGTGGSYRSFVDNGMAEDLAAITLDDSTGVAFAVLSIDAVAHGPRRHEENWKQSWLDVDPRAYDADSLYFNPLNPRAARDNALQAAADYWALVRWAQALDWTAGQSPTGSAVRFDLDNLYYMGHSQGSTTGVGFVAYEPEIEAAVFSGAGGLLIESLANKTEPYNLPAVISVGLADPDIDRHHPVLNLVQAGAERADGVNHARQVFREPPIGSLPRDVFQTFGIDDPLTPNETQEALVRALGLEQVPNGNTALPGINTTTLPAVANRGGVTAVTVLYTGDGNNPHYVMFDRADAHRQATHFLGTSVRDGIPTVVLP